MARYTYATGYIDAVAVQERDLNGDDDFADDDEVVYYHSNTLYSVYALSDADENVVERMRYDAYGAATVLDSDFSNDADGASDVENPYTFTARRLDLESHLMQYRNRYYDPALGRFASRDFGYTDGYSLYCGYFVVLGTVDPLGMEADESCTTVVTTRIDYGEWHPGKWKKTWPLPWNKREKAISDWWLVHLTVIMAPTCGVGVTWSLTCEGRWARWIEVQKKWKRTKKRTVTTTVTTKEYCCGKLVSSSVEKSQETEKDTEYEWRRVDAEIEYEFTRRSPGHTYYTPKVDASECQKYGLLEPPED